MRMSVFSKFVTAVLLCTVFGVTTVPSSDNGGIAMAANRVTNTAEARRILHRWAKLLNDHLANMK